MSISSLSTIISGLTLKALFQMSFLLFVIPVKVFISNLVISGREAPPAVLTLLMRRQDQCSCCKRQKGLETSGIGPL